jgi:hypothetical protein
MGRYRGRCSGRSGACANEKRLRNSVEESRAFGGEKEREEMAGRFLTTRRSSGDAQLAKRGGGTVARR